MNKWIFYSSHYRTVLIGNLTDKNENCKKLSLRENVKVRPTRGSAIAEEPRDALR